jgi:hypothetical protein
MLAELAGLDDVGGGGPLQGDDDEEDMLSELAALDGM